MLRAMGLQRKISLGRWSTPLLVGLRAGRKLRGTPLDLPGYAKLRRIEKGLASEYVSAVTKLLAEGIDSDRVQQVAALPDMIRGYESIKLNNVRLYQVQLAALLAQ